MPRKIDLYRPDNPKEMTFHQDFKYKGDNFIHSEDGGYCWMCNDRTNWISLAFECWICCPKCSEDIWDELCKHLGTIYDTTEIFEEVP